MKTEAAFSLRGLSFAYGRRPVLRVGELELPAGRTVAFTGPNGSGKTTLLKLMNGLLGPFDGQLLFFGQALAGNPALRRRSVYVHQHPVLFTGSVFDNIAYGLRIRRVPPAKLCAPVEAAAACLGLADRLGRDARRLSGGETQRVAIARAVAFGADVLLLDEPTSSLDAESAVAFKSALDDFRRGGATLVFSTHDHDFAAAAADRVVRFAAGETRG